MRPSIEQLEQIRRLSDVMWGNPGLAFKKHGMPETRDEAGALLRKLHAIRDNEEEDVETRECADCGAEKPIDEFRKFGRGRMKKCLDCDRFGKAVEEQGAKKAQPTEKTSYEIKFDAPEVDPEIVREVAAKAFRVTGPFESEEEHWCLAELRDPRLSTIEQARQIFQEMFQTCSLTEAAEVLVRIADLDLS